MPATSCPVFSSIDGKPLVPKISLRDHFSRQIRSRVDFMGMLTAMAPNCDLIVEMGPGRVLAGLVGDILEEPFVVQRMGDRAWRSRGVSRGA